MLLTFSGKSQTSFHEVDGGLSQHSITCITQDNYGFLWVGTRYGLNRYDGWNTSIFEYRGKDGLSNSNILSLLVDFNGDVWIGTNGGGLNCFKYATERFSVFRNQPSSDSSISDDHVTALFEDSFHNLWIGTEQGGVCMKAPGKSSFQHFNQLPELSSSMITSIVEDEMGMIWLGTWGQGLIMLNPKTGDARKFGAESGFSSEIVHYLHKTQNEEVFVGTRKGLYMISLRNGVYSFPPAVSGDQLTQYQKELSEITVLSMVSDAKGKLYIGSENQGLYTLMPDRSEVKRDLHDPNNTTSLNSNSVWALYVDDASTLWIGTYARGLCKIDPYQRKFNNLFKTSYRSSSLGNNVVSSFVEKPSGEIWVGMEGGGVDLFNPTTSKFNRFKDVTGIDLPSNTVVSMASDQNNGLYIGTWGSGLIYLYPDGKRIKRFTSDANSPVRLTNNDIYDVFVDSRGWVWISTFHAGVNLYKPKENQLIVFNCKTSKSDVPLIGSNLVRCFYEDRYGDLWIGTEGGGLSRWTLNPQGEVIASQWYKSSGPGPNISHDAVTTVFEDTKGDIWIGTEGGGANRFNRRTNEFEYYSKSNGFPSNVVHCILEDRRGYLWFSTSKGLVEMSPSRREISTYDESDGLQGNEFFKASGILSSKGLLYFGGINGFNAFKPEEIKRNPNAPRVFISEFVLNDDAADDNDITSNLNQLVLNKKQLNLAHYQNNFSFRISVLNYSQPEKNRVSYKLERYDRNWRTIGENEGITYTNVPPGEYTLRVRASNNDGIWNPQEASLKVIVAKPWYFSTSAYVAYILFFLAILLWARYGIVRTERLHNQLQIEHMELNKARELTETRSRFFADISHEFRTPLTLIISPLKAMLTNQADVETKSTYSMMIRQAERLLNLINQILDLARLESGHMKLRSEPVEVLAFLQPLAFSFTSLADKRFINYKIEFPKDDFEVLIDREKIERVVYNLLSNAFKYTPEFGEVSIKVRRIGKEWELVVSDTGIGIPNDQILHVFNRFYRSANGKRSSEGSGIGLALTKELVELHGGWITATSSNEGGAEFRVMLPVGEWNLQDVFKNEDKPNRETLRYNELELIEGEQSGRVKGKDVTLPLVLIAEDNTDLRKFISDTLKDKYRILEAENGAIALEMAREFGPDLLVTDVMMPEMDGYELCESMKKDPTTSHIPIIILTAKASPESEEQGWEVGANYYLSKPFNPVTLNYRIKNILEKRRNYHDMLFSNQKVNTNPEKVITSNADELFIKKALKCVEENMSDSNFQVHDLAQELGVSKAQLYRKLKGIVGQSANEFIRTVRLKRAAQMLKEGQQTIAEITYEVGFNDLQYFRYCFKEQFGVNPSDYAQGVKEN